jgi:hypothetical protein
MDRAHNTIYEPCARSREAKARPTSESGFLCASRLSARIKHFGFLRTGLRLADRARVFQSQLGVQAKRDTKNRQTVEARGQVSLELNHCIRFDKTEGSPWSVLAEQFPINVCIAHPLLPHPNIFSECLAYFVA